MAPAKGRAGEFVRQYPDSAGKLPGKVSLVLDVNFVEAENLLSPGSAPEFRDLKTEP